VGETEERETLTDEQLREIEERNQTKEFRADLSLGQWFSNSFALIENCHEQSGGVRVSQMTACASSFDISSHHAC
jgi:hypothetical protein